MRNNALLSTFNDQPALLHTGMQNQFEAFLAEAQVTLNRIEASNDNVVMADDFWPSPDSWLATYRPYIVKAGILMIPVKGVLLYGVGYAIGDYATGYVYITKALERGLADPEVKGIALIVDSGGGHVAGCFDLGDKIFAARDKKPIRAFAAEVAYSAAYLLFSAAEPGTATVARTGGVGSIGVVTVHLDLSKMMENEGVKVTFVHYGKHKVDGNPYEALPADVKERKQARIDELGEIFVSVVARNRSMDVQAARDTEALTFTAKEATSNGLADSIGSLDDAIAVFAADMSNQEEDDMSNPQDKSAVDQAAVDTARSEGFAEGVKAGKIEGAKAEKDRRDTIMSSEEAKLRPIAAAAAVDTGMAADQAVTFLAKLPEEKPVAAVVDDKAPKGKNGAAADFQAAMDGSDHPNAGVPVGDVAKPSRAQAAAAAAGRLKLVDK